MEQPVENNFEHEAGYEEQVAEMRALIDAGWHFKIDEEKGGELLNIFTAAQQWETTLVPPDFVEGVEKKFVLDKAFPDVRVPSGFKRSKES